MSIRNIIIHEVIKEITSTKGPGPNLAKINPRNQQNEVDKHALNLVQKLNSLFSNTGLSTGAFIKPENDNDEVPHFLRLLKENYKSSNFSNFVEFTQAAARVFKDKLDQSSGNAQGGYLWFNHYSYGPSEFLSIVLLRKKEALELKSDLTLGEITELDLEKLHMAARINLSAWEFNESDRYIAFKIGSRAKDVTDYFLRFIGCSEYTQSKEDTQNLVEVSKRYAAKHKFTDEQTIELKQFIFDQCISWLNSDNEVHISNISEILDKRYSIKESEKGSFLKIAQEDPFFTFRPNFHS